MRAAEVRFGSVAAADRRRASIVLVALAVLLVPVAITWACGPNRAFQLSHSSCEPGCTMSASGSNYPAGSQLSLSLEPGGPLGSVTVPPSGSFSMSFSAPSSPGSYVVLLQGFDPATGDPVAGTPARQSFSITASVSQPAAPAQPQDPGPTADATPAPAAPGASAPSAPAQSGTPATPPRATAPGTASATTSGRRSERPAARDGAGSDRGGRGSGSGSAAAQPAAVAEPVGVVDRSGEQVFAGSISRSERTSGAKAARPAASSATARPSERSVGAEVWSGFNPSDGPSLLPQAGAVDAPKTGAESALLYGVLMLAVGSLALVGGLAVAAARRRRA
jgi:hypothetical protein